MARVLIAEDDPNKADWLAQFVAELDPRLLVVRTRSYNTALAYLCTENVELLLLDMSMPTFDMSSEESGGEMRAFAGRELLRELQRRSITTRTIVVTQYEGFGEGTDRKTLDELRTELKGKFGEQFVGAVYYQPADTSWQEKLKALIRRVIP